MPYQPPFTLTNTMLRQVANIAEKIGEWRALQQTDKVPQLRRGNRIKTIQASLAIEHNTLSLEQVTAVIDGKSVLGLPREIQEVKNAFTAYESALQMNPTSVDQLLKAHALLMAGLVDDAGQFRHGGVGIFQEKQLVHMAPPAKQVPRLIEDLMHWLQQTDLHPLIASCVFHYEFEFIHPFSDGNGRMGRLWQTVILSHWQSVLGYLPVETVIKAHQQRYYALLGEADEQADCTAFVEFLLSAIDQTLSEATTQETAQETTQENTPNKIQATPDHILRALKANPNLTQKQLAQSFDMTTDGIKYHLKKLKQAGKLRRQGPTKGGYWEVVDNKDKAP